MKVKKILATMVILGATGLFAAGLSSISVLVDQINNASNLEVKSDLMKNLNKKLSELDEKDLPAAQALVDEKLQKTK